MVALAQVQPHVLRGLADRADGFAQFVARAVELVALVRGFGVAVRVDAFGVGGDATVVHGMQAQGGAALHAVHGEHPACRYARMC